MCGYIYNVIDFPVLEPLLDIAGYNESEIREIIKQPGLRPTETALNLIPSKTGPRIIGSTWWLATHSDGSVNTKLTTFNARANKLDTSPLHLSSPRSIRSIILASGFCEWQPIYHGGFSQSELPGFEGAKSTLKPNHKIQQLIQHPDTNLMLLGAVSKLRVSENGEPHVNTAIITLPPHQQFMNIHSKSFPLVLNIDEIEQWLNPAIPNAKFHKLLTQNRFRQQFSATPVNQILQPLSPAVQLNK